MTERGKSDLIAIVRYDNAAKAMDWLERAFGFERELVVQEDADSITFAYMRLNNDFIGTGSTRPGLRQAIGVYVPDVDAHYAHAKAAGAEIVEEPKDEDYGRAYSARDPGGHWWSFGTIRPEKPPGCDIFPVIGYEDEEAAIAFLKDAFGFEERMMMRADDGSIMHSELGLDYATVMPTRSQAGGDNPWANVDFGLGVWVEDVEGVYGRAKAAGAEIIRELSQRDYGAREFSVRDIEGRLWSIGDYRPQGSRP